VAGEIGVDICPRHASVDALERERDESLQHIGMLRKQRTILHAQNADLVEALEKLESWANAYPLDIFPEPDFKEIAKVLKAAGHSIDTVSASNMRHVINQTKEIVSAALAKAKGK